MFFVMKRVIQLLRYVCNLHRIAVYQIYTSTHAKFYVNVSPCTVLVFLPTFRRKVGFGLPRWSTVEVGSKFSGHFEMKVLRKNYFYGFIYSKLRLIEPRIIETIG